MIECGKGSSRDSVDGNTRSKEPHLSPKTLSTSVLKTEIPLKELNPNQQLRLGPGEEPGAEPEPGSRLKASKSHSIFGKRGSYSLETEEKEENGVTTLSFQHTQTDSFS
ncbi:uncharacterized protein LOC111697343 [Eurytemora carolleeae]|uniref:uncharacterized protein LOC111697343 n=1 Tax=Eurytemora carolleeae TaxID=1294199 RepID=UPI000C78CA54|nr:uncharacterized protein LOC111697343 [Eurytemora carolleeae]|eukprot:XP_023323092.1 uncharacterized protein LOC111697343 [Eurytemora affinis]